MENIVLVAYHKDQFQVQFSSTYLTHKRFSECFQQVLFVDDTNILYPNKRNSQNIVNKEDKIHKQLCTNTLSINLTKTKFMVFSKSTNFVLRVLLYNRMTWKKHKLCFNKLFIMHFGR